MKRPLNKSSISYLASHGDPPCVTLTMESHGEPARAQEDRLHFRELCDRIARQLEPKLKSGSRELVSELGRLADEGGLGSRSGGLALFVDARGAQGGTVICSSTPMVESSVVADRFHLLPLLRPLAARGRYFLLRLSLHDAQVFEGSEVGLERVDVPGLPRSLDLALGAPVKEGHVNVRSLPGVAGGAVYHGHGTGKRPQPEDLARYFRAVATALVEQLRGHSEPLLLAAPKTYHGHFGSICRYPFLLEHGLLGNFERTPLVDLHARAWPLVAAAQETAIVRWLERFTDLQVAGRALDEPSEIARAALMGRVECLVLEEGGQLVGRLDARSGGIDLGASPWTADAPPSALLEGLAEAVLLRAGEVRVLPRARMPSASAVAALLRW